MAIQILPPDVINQIAAGEVLERPANLVKELVENSIDALATDIEIDLDLGGKYLKITDNGVGMAEADLSLSLNRHSTSKIEKFSDLWSLGTYGFRGEALASTAAVSHMSITTRPKESEIALQLKSVFGNQSDVQKVGGTYGTQIVIEELFSNVPARFKFLKSDAAEITQIMKVVKAFALTHPNVTFKVKQRGVLKAFYPKTESLLTRAQSIFDVKELFQATQDNGQMKLQVIYSSPKVVNQTAQNIWIFVQKRWIQDRGIQRAILDSYRNLLMHGEYPYCVIHLNCDPQTIDVNIHPTKSQVKFQDASQSFRIVHHTLRTSLEKAPWLKNLFNENSLEQRTSSQLLQEPRDLGGVSSAVESYSQSHMDNLDRESFFTTQFKQKSDYIYEATNTAESDSQKSMEGINQGPLWGALQVLGQVNLTYILAQSRYALFLVDQHAAHERVAFEKLMQSYKSGQFEVQDSLLPLQIDFENDKFEVLMSLKDQLKKLGIEIEQSGPATVSVVAAPTIMKEKAISEILSQMANEASEAGGSYSIEKKIGDIFASIACHSVVRAGQSLSQEEMKQLLVQMDEFPLSSFCPHGRPVYKQLSFRELDRDFGRIV